ncbi:MAG: DUF1499 domain-containing protein [Alphaproteobacteria bacterium]|nr:DUF1499 domain-containing protein [Alphaproteobacteria bacterium]
MIDFATLERPPSPNTYLVAPPGLCRAAEPELAAPKFPQAAPVVRDAFFRMAAKQPRVTYGAKDDTGLQYELVQRSALFRFPDTITVRFIPLAEGGSTLAIYSRSQVGYSDMGVNRKRVQAWLAALDAEVRAAP